MRVELYFAGKDVELVATTFFHDMEGAPLRSVRGKLPGAHFRCGTFQWTKAVKALSLLCVKTKAFALGEGANQAHEYPVIVGKGGSLAAALDEALHREPVWLLDMFGGDKDGRPLARRLMCRTNPGRKRREMPVHVALNFRLISAKDIHLFFDDEKVSSVKQVRLLFERMQAALGHERQSRGKVLEFRRVSAG